MTDSDLSLRPRAGESAEDTLARVINAAKNVVSESETSGKLNTFGFDCYGWYAKLQFETSDPEEARRLAIEGTDNMLHREMFESGNVMLLEEEEAENV